MRFFDWLNDNPWIVLIVGIIIMLMFNCATPQTTVDLQNKAAQTEDAIEKGKEGCQTLECQDAMEKSKDYIKDSINTVKYKDSKIKTLQEEKEDLIIAHKKDLDKKDSIILKRDLTILDLEDELVIPRRIKHYFWQTVWLLLGILFLYLLWRFRDTVWSLAKATFRIP